MQRYQPFLQALYGQWASLPSCAELVAHFGAETLRRSRLVVKWIDESGALVVDADVTFRNRCNFLEIDATGSITLDATDCSPSPATCGLSRLSRKLPFLARLAAPATSTHDFTR